ncbi:hypothetical protein evm_013332 [Chilo suppressalis]|nr:hypothetical protein evm_013332 [Chilo suppressalis]
MERRPQCISCRLSLGRTNNRLRRSYVLTPDYRERHAFILDYLADIRHVREIEDGNRICRPCFQRALRYS